MCLAHWLDAERGGQLAEEQPRNPRRAVRHGVEERAQRCSRPDAAAVITLCFGHVGTATSSPTTHLLEDLESEWWVGGSFEK
eukprot:4528682-Prymnesium_polylepis.1